ncbi:pentatricopeptide repeat protein [Geosmithia morbida]|uniref:Pentatricopeptide repeat protein n=1 Tax=Geosmithia morbida TaxID=1094350 RepID=A0A9P4YYJ1_9HYPO|nr:pentatricopeptide repeat protein [Geosmithia morbida]KAF4125250.1 pentatricopeptide repeat protein [Geosmithia morbida]
MLCDGLWRCLCPSYTPRALLRAVQTPLPIAARRAARQWPHGRQFGVETPRAPTRNDGGDSQEIASAATTSRMDEVLLRPTPPTEETLSDTPTEEIAAALRRMRAVQGFSVHGQRLDRYQRILQLVEHLVGKRGWPPSDAFVYECMMDAMADPRGSASGVRALLRSTWSDAGPSEMACRSALTALSVHPDYALRQQVLSAMRTYWMAEDDRDVAQSVLAAMLREGQVEMAYDRLMRLVDDGERVDLWLYDVFVVVLAREGHLDEMLSVLLRRKQAKGADHAMLSLTGHALDVCAAASHLDGVVWAWTAAVRNDRIQPSDGVLENVLATAARHGNVGIATEAHAMLSRRGRVQIHHYEALVDAFARDADAPGALRVLNIMQRSGFRVEREHTRSVYALLRSSDNDVLDAAEAALREMADESQDGRVPPGIVSVVVEARSKNHRGGSDAAHALYADFRHLTGEDPAASTIQDMILHSNVFDRTRGYLDDYKRLVPGDEPPPQRLPMAANKLALETI